MQCLTNATRVPKKGKRARKKGKKRKPWRCHRCFGRATRKLAIDLPATSVGPLSLPPRISARDSVERRKIIPAERVAEHRANADEERDDPRGRTRKGTSPGEAVVFNESSFLSERVLEEEKRKMLACCRERSDESPSSSSDTEENSSSALLIPFCSAPLAILGQCRFRRYQRTRRAVDRSNERPIVSLRRIDPLAFDVSRILKRTRQVFSTLLNLHSILLLPIITV